MTSCGVTIVINGIRGPAPSSPHYPDMPEMYDGSFREGAHTANQALMCFKNLEVLNYLVMKIQ